MTFENRWMIIGTLTTESPMHIGNGDITHRSELKDSKNRRPVEINAVCTDKDHHAFIPGSTLKGNLRAWARVAAINSHTFDQLFGSEDPEAPNSVGGKVEFYNAVAQTEPSFSETNEPPYWDAQRRTGVMAGVAIDRRTRTAIEERLFYHEFVPPGVTFAVTVTGQNLSDAEVEDLLFILASFNQNQIALGAGEEDGWGRMTWELVDLRRITPTEVAKWMSAGSSTVGYDAAESIPLTEQETWKERINARQGVTIPPLSVTLDVILEFDSHFLVNDPWRSGSVKEGKTSQTPLFDVNGRLLLPASSFRGAFRSQAEKILRTIGGQQAACYPDKKAPRPACGAVYDTTELAGLCPACKVFGAPGWRSPITITSFTTSDPVDRTAPESTDDRGHQTGKYCKQEFVAIDRFTGGGAHGSETAIDQPEQGDGEFAGKKFNAASVYRPQLSGKVSIDLRALKCAGVAEWGLGLLALTLRDLIEGDVRFGYGAAKGYGAARAKLRIAELPSWNDCPDELTSLLPEELWTVAGLTAIENTSLRAALRAQVEAIPSF